MAFICSATSVSQSILAGSCSPMFLCCCLMSCICFLPTIVLLKLSGLQCCLLFFCLVPWVQAFWEYYAGSGCHPPCCYITWGTLVYMLNWWNTLICGEYNYLICGGAALLHTVYYQPPPLVTKGSGGSLPFYPPRKPHAAFLSVTHWDYFPHLFCLNCILISHILNWHSVPFIYRSWHMKVTSPVTRAFLFTGGGFIHSALGNASFTLHLQSWLGTVNGQTQVVSLSTGITLTTFLSHSIRIACLRGLVTLLGWSVPGLLCSPLPHNH